MLADSLTKSMEAGHLQECLRTGRYKLFDESETLKQRATKREKLKWLQGNTSAAHEHEGEHCHSKNYFDFRPVLIGNGVHELSALDTFRAASAQRVRTPQRWWEGEGIRAKQ